MTCYEARYATCCMKCNKAITSGGIIIRIISPGPPTTLRVLPALRCWLGSISPLWRPSITPWTTPRTLWPRSILDARTLSSGKGVSHPVSKVRKLPVCHGKCFLSPGFPAPTSRAAWKEDLFFVVVALIEKLKLKISLRPGFSKGSVVVAYEGQSCCFTAKMLHGPGQQALCFPSGASILPNYTKKL